MYRDTYRNAYQISRYVSLVEKVYRYTPTCRSTQTFYFWFRANQSLLLLLNAACLEERATNTNFKEFGLTQLGLDALNLQSQRLKASITIIMPLMRLPISLRLDLWNIFCPVSPAWYRADNVFGSLISTTLRQLHEFNTYWLYFYNLVSHQFVQVLSESSTSFQV